MKRPYTKVLFVPDEVYSSLNEVKEETVYYLKHFALFATLTRLRFSVYPPYQKEEEERRKQREVKEEKSPLSPLSLFSDFVPISSCVSKDAQMMAYVVSPMQEQDLDGTVPKEDRAIAR